MPFNPDADFTAMLDTNEHATSAVFSRSGATVYVIFDADYQDPMGQEASTPMAEGKASDFSGVVQGDTLTISSIAYRISNVQPDGTGWLSMKLRKPS